MLDYQLKDFQNQPNLVDLYKPLIALGEP